MKEKVSVGKIDIIVDRENKYMEMYWHANTSSEVYRSACLKVLELLKVYPTHKFLYDQRNMGIISVADTKWTYEYFYSTYMEIVGRHQKSAVVLSSSVFGEFSVKNLVQGIQKTKDTNEDALENKYFNDEKEAVKWLISN